MGSITLANRTHMVVLPGHRPLHSWQVNGGVPHAAALEIAAEADSGVVAAASGRGRSTAPSLAAIPEVPDNGPAAPSNNGDVAVGEQVVCLMIFRKPNNQCQP
jgi:hypothetical protein